MAQTPFQRPFLRPQAVLGLLLSLLLLTPARAVQAALGSWELAPMPPANTRMQAVHSVLLPNGKVLVVNGSSFRTQYLSPDPATGEATLPR